MAETLAVSLATVKHLDLARAMSVRHAHYHRSYVRHRLFNIQPRHGILLDLFSFFAPEMSNA